MTNDMPVVINSILDIKDETPLPKSVAVEAVFNRSIVILTPERALKFTTTSKDQHYLWLTALSFMANPSQCPPPVPRIPTQHLPDYAGSPDAASPSDGAAIDWSIKHLKIRSKPRSTTVSAYHAEALPTAPSLFADDISASPTSPPTSLSSFSRKDIRKHRRTSSTRNLPISPSAPRKISLASALSSTRPPAVDDDEQTDLFLPMETMSMDAFVDPVVRRNKVVSLPPPPLKSLRRPGSSRGTSQLSVLELSQMMADSVFEAERGDVFGGF